jgi:hypothetical protein
MLLNEKDASSSKRDVAKTRPSLMSRPADLVYFIFFVTHIPPTLLLDLQAVYPQWLVPMDSPLRSLATYYVSMTNDPVVGGVGGMFGSEFRHSLLWIISFMHVELYAFPASVCYQRFAEHILDSYNSRPSFSALTASTTTRSFTSSTRCWYSMGHPLRPRLFPAYCYS